MIYKPTIIKADEPTVLVFSNEKIKAYSLNQQSKWTLGRPVQYYIPNISIASPIVSKEHGEFIKMDNYWFWCNNKCKNGTYYNNKKITEGLHNQIRPIFLNDGDVLTITSSDFTSPHSVLILYIDGSVYHTWEVYSLNKQINYILGSESSEAENIVLSSAPLQYQYAQIIYSNNQYIFNNCSDITELAISNPSISTLVPLKESNEVIIKNHQLKLSSNKLIHSISK